MEQYKQESLPLLKPVYSEWTGQVPTGAGSQIYSGNCSLPFLSARQITAFTELQTTKINTFQQLHPICN